MLPSATSAADRRHDDRVRGVVEETLNVGVQHKPVAAFMVFEEARAMAPWQLRPREAEAEGRVVRKLRLEDRRQETPKHLLRDPIPNRRDAQRTEFVPLPLSMNRRRKALGLKTTRP